jgi:pentatricopeptide repeat protein
LGEFSSAFSLLSQALLSPEESFKEEALFYLFNSAYRLERWDTVVEVYSQMENKNDSSIRFRAALAYYYLGNYEQSISLLRNLQDEPNFSSSSTSLLVEELFLLKDYAECGEEGEKFLAAFPQDPQRERILYLTSWAFYYAGEIEKAEGFIKSYQEEFPEGKYGEELFSLLADIYLSQGKTDEAITVLQQMEESSDSRRKLYTWYRLGNAYLSKGDFSNALPYFQNLFQVGENEYQTVAGYQWGVCLEYLDKLDEAKDVYQAVIKTAKEDQWVSKAQERWNLLNR